MVVGWPTVCAGSGKPGKKRRRRTRRCVHTKQTRTSEEGLVISSHAELRLYVQVSLHETHGLENATCHSTQEYISL